MFNLFKKKKNQEDENVEISKTISKISDSSFPSAKDFREMTQKSWKTITADELLKKMKSEAAYGNRTATFYSYYISDELVTALTAKGYKVEICEPCSVLGPRFRISW